MKFGLYGRSTWRINVNVNVNVDVDMDMDMDTIYITKWFHVGLQG